MKKSLVFITLIMFLISGCATTGPRVTSQEIQEAQERLTAKAVKHKFDQLQRVANIGYKLIISLPEEDREKDYPFLGIYVTEIDKQVQQAYNLTEKRGVVIVAIVKDTPAEKSGLQVGDVILRIGNKKVKGTNSFKSALSPTMLKDKKEIDIEIDRYGEIKIFTSEIGTVPRKISFDMVDEQTVNAGAMSNMVAVTYGLINFAKSDDEIAVVLGHELAHITKGHIAKSAGLDMLTGTAAIGLGILSEYFAPGTGSAVIQTGSDIGQVFGRGYSRDLEREADYFGTKYAKIAGFDYETGSQWWERFAVEIPKSMISNYLSTHPSSAERMVRMQKIIEELKAEDNAVPAVEQ